MDSLPVAPTSEGLAEHGPFRWGVASVAVGAEDASR